MDLEGKKRKQMLEGQSSFLADFSYIPPEGYNAQYVTAMLPPQDVSEDYYCQINNSEKSYQIPDCNYEEVDDIDCDPGVDVDDLFGQSLGFVCEEVMLLKSPGDRFGLTLFYCQNYNDPRISDIFVGEIESNSPASYAIGLRLGDQVLQINHQDVYTRDQVMQLFSQSTNHIHLLLARSASEQLKLMTQTTIPHSPSDPYIMANMQNALDSYATLETQPSIDALDADSGMGRLTDENFKAEDSSDCSSFYSRHGASSIDANMPPLPDDFIDLDVSKINEELNKLRWQCLFLEQVKAQKEISQKSQESVNKPVPRMGTRVPPRSSNSTVPMVVKIESLKPQPLTFKLSEENEDKFSPPILRFSAEPSDNNAFPQTSNNSVNEIVNQSSKEKYSAPLEMNPYSFAEHSKEMQWVMKKRSDGSKYVVKRPMRNQILRERAKQLAADRQTQSTDDDAVSEIKTGKYWSRSERKRHFEKYREYRKQKESVKQQFSVQEDQIVSKTRKEPEQDDGEVRVMLTFL